MGFSRSKQKGKTKPKLPISVKTDQSFHPSTWWWVLHDNEMPKVSLQSLCVEGTEWPTAVTETAVRWCRALPARPGSRGTRSCTSSPPAAAEPLIPPGHNLLSERKISPGVAQVGRAAGGCCSQGAQKPYPEHAVLHHLKHNKETPNPSKHCGFSIKGEKEGKKTNPT